MQKAGADALFDRLTGTLRYLITLKQTRPNAADNSPQSTSRTVQNDGDTRFLEIIHFMLFFSLGF